MAAAVLKRQGCTVRNAEPSGKLQMGLFPQIIRDTKGTCK